MRPAVPLRRLPVGPLVARRPLCPRGVLGPGSQWELRATGASGDRELGIAGALAARALARSASFGIRGFQSMPESFLLPQPWERRMMR